LTYNSLILSNNIVQYYVNKVWTTIIR